MIEVVRFLGVLLLCGALGACYNPSYGDCQVSCASGTCPAGLECQSGVCRAPGMTGPCTAVDGGTDANGLPLEELTQATVDSLCEYMVRCGQFEDMATCEKLYGNLLVRQNDLSAAVSAGSVIFHGDVAKACLDARASVGCERWKASTNRVVDISCTNVFEGTRHDGEACVLSEQCISQSCKLENCSNACCPGTCVGDRAPGPRNLGESCTPADRCQNGYCDQVTSVCAAYKAANDNCMYSDQCADGYACITSLQFPMGRCQMLVATNGACTQSAECSLLGDVCKNGGTCSAGGLTGSGCTTQSDCQTFHPCTNQTCAKPPVVGESCLNVAACAEGYCSYSGDPTMPLCTAKQPDLAACNQNMGGFECMSGYCNAGTCDQRPVCN